MTKDDATCGGSQGHEVKYKVVLGQGKATRNRLLGVQVALPWLKEYQTGLMKCFSLNLFSLIR